MFSGGIYNIPVTFVSGTPIKSQEMNDVFQDFKLGFQKCLTTDGQTKPSTNIDWNNKKIINMADGTSDKDGATFKQANKVTKFYVDGVSGVDTNNGLTLTTPFKSVKKAVDMSPSQGYSEIVILGDELEAYTWQVIDKRITCRATLNIYPLTRAGAARQGKIIFPWRANELNEYNIDAFVFDEQSTSVVMFESFHIVINAKPSGVTFEDSDYLGVFVNYRWRKKSILQLNFGNCNIENLSVTGKLVASNRVCVGLTIASTTHTGMAGNWVNGIASGTAPKDTNNIISNLSSL